jgi:hypothetical protein
MITSRESARSVDLDTTAARDAVMWSRDRNERRPGACLYRERLALLHESLATELVLALRRKRDDRVLLDHQAQAITAITPIGTFHGITDH